MNLIQLLDELGRLNLPKDQYAITSSGPMAVRGLREAGDLDLVVSENLWLKLAQKYEVTPGPPCDKIQIGNIEILGKFSVYQDEDIATAQQQIDTADIIQGHRFVNLNLIKQFKQKLGREKDLKDIALIDQYLSSQNPA